MKKLLFLIHTLGGGGAEKALVNLVNNLDASKYDITVQTMFGDGVNVKNLKTHIHYVSKNAPCPKGISIILKFIPSKILYKYFVGSRQYDVLIAYMHGAPVKVITGNKKARKIAWLHNGNPETSTMFASWLSLKKAIEAYDSCDSIIGVCKSVSDAFSQYTKITDKVKVVYNTLDTDCILEQAKHSVPISIDEKSINMVSIGRLSKEKGYLRLIDVCKKLKENNYQFRLFIIGEGSEEAVLRNQIKELSLENEVKLLGYFENPYNFVDKCNIFICSSYTEGLSTATIEALILGKAIVSTNVSGAFEILGNNEYGLVVENSIEGIYDGLKKYLDNSDFMNKYGLKAKQRGKFFSISNTVNLAEEVIDDVF